MDVEAVQSVSQKLITLFKLSLCSCGISSVILSFEGCVRLSNSAKRRDYIVIFEANTYINI